MDLIYYSRSIEHTVYHFRPSRVNRTLSYRNTVNVCLIFFFFFVFFFIFCFMNFGHVLFTASSLKLFVCKNDFYFYCTYHNRNRNMMIVNVLACTYKLLTMKFASVLLKWLQMQPIPASVSPSFCPRFCCVYDFWNGMATKRKQKI